MSLLDPSHLKGNPCHQLLPCSNSSCTYPQNNLCQSWFELTSIPWQILGRMSLGEAAPMEMATSLPPLLPGGGLKEKRSHCEVKYS